MEQEAGQKRSSCSPSFLQTASVFSCNAQGPLPINLLHPTSPMHPQMVTSTLCKTPLSPLSPCSPTPSPLWLLRLVHSSLERKYGLFYSPENRQVGEAVGVWVLGGVVTQPIPAPGGTSASSHVPVKLFCPMPGWNAEGSVQHNHAVNRQSANTPPPPANVLARRG